MKNPEWFETNGDPANCGRCIFKTDFNECSRIGLPIRSFSVCRTGPLERVKDRQEERVLLLTWASEDLSKARQLAKIDGMDQYGNYDLQSHYAKTAQTLSYLREIKEKKVV